jgi:hypothetical protein
MSNHLLKVSLLRRFWFLLLLGTLIGCGSLSYLGLAVSSVTPIKELQQQKTEATVNIKGKVKAQAPFLGSGSYQLQDETGSVWIFTKGSLPPLGSEVMVKGQLQYQSIPVETQEVGEFYLVELEQIQPQTASQTPSPIPTPTASPSPSQPNTNVIPTDDPFLPHKENRK